MTECQQVSASRVELTFAHYMSAFIAQQQCHNLFLAKHAALLSIKWLPPAPTNSNTATQPQYQRGFDDSDSQKVPDTQLQSLFRQNCVDDTTTAVGPTSHASASQTPDSGIKYTAKFDVQIADADGEFQVKRRIIGARGCNMRRIVDICQKSSSQTSSVGGDVVKLSLCGVGSDSGKEESALSGKAEPLHLLVSSRHYYAYKVACEMVSDLLLQVYEEYKKHCEKYRLDLRLVGGDGACSSEAQDAAVLQIKKSEAVTGRRTQIQTLNNTFAAGKQSQQIAGISSTRPDSGVATHAQVSKRPSPTGSPIPQFRESAAASGKNRPASSGGLAFGQGSN